MSTTHLQFLSSDEWEVTVFKKACELAGIPPTRRQVSKWRRREGAAWKKFAAANRELGQKEQASREEGA